MIYNQHVIVLRRAGAKIRVLLESPSHGENRSSILLGSATRSIAYLLIDMPSNIREINIGVRGNLCWFKMPPPAMLTAKANSRPPLQLSATACFLPTDDLLALVFFRMRDGRARHRSFPHATLARRRGCVGSQRVLRRGCAGK